MPRYFFHVTFGQRTLPDEDGVELPNRPAARNEALAVVRELAEHVGTRRRWAGWFIEVADEINGFFRTPIGYPALEVVTAESGSRRVEQSDVEPLRQIPGASLAHLGTAEIIREIAARREMTIHLLKQNEQLRRELSSIYLASEGIQIRANRLLSLARAADTRY